MIEVTVGIEEDGLVQITPVVSLENRSVVYKGAYALLMTMMNEAE